MIVVVGSVPETPTSRVSAESVASRIARTGAPVEVVSVVPEGAVGDRILARLAEAGVRHAATLRSAADGLDAADLELALRYLPDIRVVVLTSEEPALRPVAVRAATWSGAALVTLASERTTGEGPGPDDGALEIVLQGPASDPDQAFAGLVAALAVRLDAGELPHAAWREVTAALGVAGVSPPEAPTRGRRPG